MISDPEIADINELLDIVWRKFFIHVQFKQRELDVLLQNGEITASANAICNKIIVDNWSNLSELTLLDPFRAGVLVELVIKTRNVEGDIVECGCYRGGTGILLGLALEKIGSSKKVHLFDSFEGLPDTDDQLDTGYSSGQFQSDYGELQENIRKHNLQERVILHKGWFSETIPSYMEACNSISLLHIDCDLYKSTIESFGVLKPSLTNYSAVVFDDYNDGAGGEREAVKSLINTELHMHIGPSPQAYYIAGEVLEGEHTSCDDNIKYNFDNLLENNSYLSFLEKYVAIDYRKMISSFLSANK